MTTSIEEALRSGAWRLVPVEASESLLRSMAIRSDHGLGCPGYYDQPVFGAENVGHARRLESAMTTMRQLHEEVVGSGFHRPPDDPTPALVALIEERDRLKVERDALSSLAGAAMAERDKAKVALTAAEAKCDALREAAVGTAAALAAAISVLERTPKAAKVAPSDRMFDQMLSDYRAALEATRRALTQETPDVGE